MSSPDVKLSENIWFDGLEHHTMEKNGDVTIEQRTNKGIYRATSPLYSEVEKITSRNFLTLM